MVCIFSCIGAAGAQERPGSGSTEPPAQGDSTRPVARVTSPWSVTASASSVFDSNINRDEESLDSYGTVAGTLVQYQNRFGPHRLNLEYEAAAHQYTGTDRWDRVSQRLRAAFRRDLSDRWYVEGISEISLKGSSEDRNIGNHYILEPRLTYRIDDDTDLRLNGAARLRRFEEEPEQNALNRYVGAEFTQEADGDREWEVEARYEINGAENERRRYRRWTWRTAFATPVSSRDHLQLELRIRTRRFTHRLVEIEDEDVLREDHRWTPFVQWTRQFPAGLGLVLQYEYETRASNDPEQAYRGHQVGLSLRRRLW